MTLTTITLEHVLIRCSIAVSDVSVDVKRFCFLRLYILHKKRFRRFCERYSF